ncbi:DMT family transporter [Marinomonas rhizomae]|uniref:Drug/metabolite transporter (DMT)-like permease n=1 Tax=Marinomonas rhizomae TaxID=491948 RepID=A0A366J5R6_9GAMM|nr:DMT family transporter [Marinomonas rhizomae]RBP81750.1 drug/metabolite transporter (DMT)-like permease [Marinomonas rhizomae]RNF72876.1 DMT family transporter [Marinomonas rhizomae]
MLDDNELLKKGIVMTIAYAFVMSLTALAAKQAQTMIAVSTLVFWQSVFCALVLLPQMRGRWKKRPLSVWKIHFLRSFGGFIGFLFYYWSLNHIPLVEASLLRTCAPLCVPFVVLILHKIRIPKARWLPLIIGFVGVAFVIQPTPEHLNPWHIIGFISAIGLALSMVTTRMLSHQVSGQETLFVYFLVSTILSVPLMLVQGDSFLLPVAVWLPVAVVTITLYVGMYLYNLAYTYAPASIVSPVSYIGVVFSGFWGWVVWGHVPDIFAILGMLFIFSSILISTRMARHRG